MNYINVPRLERLFFKCYKILPAVYDESLSYYEQLCKVTYSLNETIEAVNNLNENVSALNERCNTFQDEIEEIANIVNTFVEETEAKIDAIIDEKLEDFENQFNELAEKTQQEIDILNKEMNEFINETFPALEARIEEVISDELKLIDAKFDTLETELQDYIKDELQKILDSIPEITGVTIIDPTTGELAPIQKVVWDIYNFFIKDKLLNCGELDSLELTCYQIDNYEVDGKLRGLTALEWDSDTKRIFHWVDDKCKVPSYKDGSLVTLDKNVDFNNAMIRMSGYGPDDRGGHKSGGYPA